MKYLKQYAKYVSGSWLIGILEILLTVILTEVFKFWFFYSYFFSLLMGALLLFFYHNHVTFDIKSYNLRRIMYFMLFMLIMTMINLGGVYLLVVTFSLNYVVAILVIGIFTSISGFVINKNLLFKQIRVIRKGVQKSVKGVKKISRDVLRR